MNSPSTNPGEPFSANNAISAIQPKLKSIFKWGPIVLGLIILLVVLSTAKSIYTNWLWFDHLGFSDVYRTMILTRASLFMIGTLIAAIFISVNLILAYRLSRGEFLIPLSAQATQWIHKLIKVGIILGTIIISIIFGLSFAGKWEIFLLFYNQVPFGITDPLYQKDLGLYVFTLPVLNFIQGWAVSLIIVSGIAVSILHLLQFSVRGVRIKFTSRILHHLLVLVALFLFAQAMNHLLDIYDLVHASGGATVGASYTDIHARLPGLRLLTGIGLLSGLLVLLSIVVGGTRLSIGATSLWIIAFVLAGGIYPTMIQRLAVNPNELEREAPYIQRNIDFTRLGFGLDTVDVRSFPANEIITSTALNQNQETIRNIRLWDHNPIQDVYNQIQVFRLQYNFTDVDVDRYWLDGEYRQVMLSARELLPENLPQEAQRWVNQKLQFTHGYGLAMSPVTEFTTEGRPEFLLSDIPIHSKQEYAETLSIDRPEVYYGETHGEYVITNSRMAEFSYPTPEDVPVYTRYQGTGGVQLSSLLRRIIYAWEFRDINLLVSGQITPESRIQYHRHLMDRIQTVAPFLELDGNPYLVVSDQKLWWVQDAYTTTNRFPYSTPLEGDHKFNYVRNSAKVVMDAYNGSFKFYISDPQDPLVLTYQQTFPVLLEPLDNLSPTLRQHLRYPEDLFSWQSTMFLQYHMEDPTVFFNKEDQWGIPQEVFFGSQQHLEPYYMIMRLPEEEKEEFVLILPFIPRGKPNLVAWLAARSDGQHYGKLVNFVFPRGQQIDGPSQIEARIDNDPVISQQFTLWGQVGSTVIRGNLLVIPLQESLLYVEPVYLQSSTLPFPELKRVIVATSDKVVMADSLTKALPRLLLGTTQIPSTPLITETSKIGSNVQAQMNLLSEAINSLRETLTSAEEKLRRLKDLLEGGE